MTVETLPAVSISWKQWLIILPVCVAFSLLTDSLAEADMLPLWARSVALGGMMTAAWVVYFLQRAPRAALAETAALLGLISGLECYLMLHSEQQLGAFGSYCEVMALVLIAPLSFLTRQRLLIAVSLGVLFICVMRCPGIFNEWYLFICGMALWLLGERWRTNRGSKYRCYSWVGIPGFLIMWVALAAARDMSMNGLILALSMVAVAALLFLALRPRSGWELPKPLCVFTCLQPLIAGWNLTVQMLAMVAYAALLFIAAAHTGRRSWLVLGSVLVMIGASMLSFYCPSHIFWVNASVGVGISAAAWLWAARQMPEPQPEEPVPFPVAGWQLWLVGLLLCGQLGCLFYYYLEPQAELRSAPRALMAAQWERPGKIIHHRCRLRIKEKRSLLQDSAFIGRSLWWGAEPAGAQNAAPHPPAEGVQGAQELRSYMNVAAFLQQGEAGLWHIDRIEAPGSSEDAPRAGELRVPVIAALYNKQDIVCTLSFKTYPKSPMWEEAELNRWLRDNHEKLSFTAEVAIRRKRGPVITRFFVNGIPLPEVVQLVRAKKFHIGD